MPNPAFVTAAAQFGDPDTPYLSPQRVAERLGVTLTELAKLAGVSRNTLSGKASARRVDAALSPIVRILASAAEMSGDERRAAIWFKHQPIPGWGGKAAQDLVRQGDADKVLEYLEAVRSGVYA
ncbi:MAG: antitoxin Xre/MbcA/ParS toxin-binding domain-containing protein [Variibacter sp.]